MLLVNSMDSDVLEQRLGRFQSDTASDQVIINENTYFLIADDDPNFMFLRFDEGFVVFKGEHSSKSDIIAYVENNNIAKSIDEIADIIQGCFSVAIYSKKNQTWSFISDHLSLYPWYYCEDESTITVSARLSEIQQLIGAEIDEAGFTEFMRHGYCVGSKTCLKDVRKLKPGFILKVDCKEASVDTFESSYSLFNEIKTQKLKHAVRPQDAANEASDLLVEACKVPDGVTLMMSAGWDSRTLLAALLSRGVRDIQLYTHGDINSREALIVRKIADDLNLEYHLEPFSDKQFSIEAINLLSKEQDNVIFPYWRHAAKYAKEKGSGHIISGVLGEVLGGHYGPTLHLAGGKKALAVGLYLTFGKLAEKFTYNSLSLEDSLSLLRENKYERPWYISKESWTSTLSDSFISTNYDIKCELESINSHFLGDIDSAMNYELFTILNRGSQYIAMQALSSQYDDCEIVVPFSHKELLAKSMAVPFRDKIHNKLNKKIVKKLYPTLLDYPTSAILTNTSRPILMQEVSRVIRKLYERFDVSFNKKQPSLGWANFNLIDHQHILDVVDSLSLDVFDENQIKNFLKARDNSRQHPLWDMVLKMKTIDNICK